MDDHAAVVSAIAEHGRHERPRRTLMMLLATLRHGTRDISGYGGCHERHEAHGHGAVQ